MFVTEIKDTVDKKPHNKILDISNKDSSLTKDFNIPPSKDYPVGLRDSEAKDITTNILNRLIDSLKDNGSVGSTIIKEIPFYLHPIVKNNIKNWCKTFKYHFRIININGKSKDKFIFISPIKKN